MFARPIFYSTVCARAFIARINPEISGLPMQPIAAMTLRNMRANGGRTLAA
jgi:hypothetical protein